MLQIKELNDFSLWVKLPRKKVEEVIAEAAKLIKDEFSLSVINYYGVDSSFYIATFNHKPTNTLFNLVPGGKYLMGFSIQEEETLSGMSFQKKRSHMTGYQGNDKKQTMNKDAGEIIDEKPYVTEFLDNTIKLLRPVHEVRVKPFLLSQKVVSGNFADLFVKKFRPDKRLFDEDHGPLSMFPEEIEELLLKTGFRLPSEAEWEYAMRAGTETLFHWGDAIPERVWKGQTNRFGFIDMGNIFELCADHWHNNYELSPTDGSAWIEKQPSYKYADFKVSRGGAAAFEPWQGNAEWLMYLSANRFAFNTKSKNSMDCQATVRLAKTVC